MKFRWSAAFTVLALTVAGCGNPPPPRWHDRTLAHRGPNMVRLRHRLVSSFRERVDEWETQVSADRGQSWETVQRGVAEHVTLPWFAEATFLPDGHVAVLAAAELALGSVSDGFMHTDVSSVHDPRWREALRWVSELDDPVGRRCDAARGLADLGERVVTPSGCDDDDG